MNIKALFINGCCMKKIAIANIVNSKETPILFLTLVPLSELLLPTVFNNVNKNNIPLTIKNIVFITDISAEKLIFLKKCE